MNREIIERLAMDRAAGELSPDVAALLEHCLAREPELALAAAETEETLRLAKQAVSASVAPRLPEPNFTKSTVVFPREFSARRNAPLWSLGMAACFLGGLLSGGFLFQDRQIPAPQEAVIKTTMVAKAPLAQYGFWSFDRLASRDKVPRPAAPSPLIWKSPVRTPELRTQ